jgi:hypothetical protein
MLLAMKANTPSACAKHSAFSSLVVTTSSGKQSLQEGAFNWAAAPGSAINSG